MCKNQCRGPESPEFTESCQHRYLLSHSRMGFRDWFAPPPLTLALYMSTCSAWSTPPVVEGGLIIAWRPRHLMHCTISPYLLKRGLPVYDIFLNWFIFIILIEMSQISLIFLCDPIQRWHLFIFSRHGKSWLTTSNT